MSWSSIPDRYQDRLEDAQMIYEFIRRRTECSAAAGWPVENEEAVVTFVIDFLEGLPAERTLLDGGADNEAV